MSDPFDPEGRRTGEETPAREPEPPSNDAPPPESAYREEPPPPAEPASDSGQEPPPPYEPPVYGRELPRSEERPWSTPEETDWPYRPESEQPPPPEPPHGLNPLVRLGVPQPWRAIIDWIVTIVGAVAIVLAIKAWVVNPYRIPSSSMEPTLHCARPASGCEARFSDRVLANRFIYHFRDPHRGEIIVFDVPKAAEEACGAGGVFVKRIIGLPGDVWQEKQGVVFINGKKLAEPYIKPDRRDFSSYPARKIPAANYFMMGDNRQSSCDSRRWGTVPRTNIIGKVFGIYWPPQRIRIM